MNKTIAPLLFACMPVFLFAQVDRPAFTPAKERMTNVETRKNLLEKSLVKNVPFESIGPSVFSGRVVDVDVLESDPTKFYVAYASGGLWKTENNGHSFTPLFDNEVVMTIGDIAVDWEREVIWIGTGEVNSSRSSYSGIGMYKSADGGKTWEHKGLPESHHIGRVILHPTDENTLWVAVLGHLYSPNQERGVYKTNDGGTTWERVLFVDGNTGAVDLAIDPDNPNILYAAMWQRERSSWDFTESGEGSGIYKSEDGGNNWQKLSTPKSGFPTGNGAGRIGLDITSKNGETYLFAIIDNQERRPKDKEEEDEGLTKEDFRKMPKADFVKLSEEKIETFLRDNRFPKKYTGKSVLKMVRKDKINPSALTEYLENANALLFDTPVIGAEVYLSKDGGLNWNKTHDDYLDGLYYSYGYYFGQIRVAQQDPDKLYIFGVPVLISEDGGKNWKSINGANVHVDHHALWVNPNKDKHLILGNDGGINISYDDGENWIKCNTPAVGQFYHIEVDMAKKYNVYGGLQDNGSWYGPHDYQASNRWHSSGRYPYKSFVGGDGMQTAVDTRDNVTVYGGLQFGNYYRVNTKTGARNRITPQHELGERPYRWNWQTPIYLSKHNQDILYMGANKLFRSLDRGNDWEAISGDLTKGGKKGDVPFGTISAIHESPLKFGLLYAGTDDGLLHISKDGGNNWSLISNDLPKDMWVSRVQASKFEEGRVYVTLNGYRWDNFSPYAYVSEDYGTTWKKIGSDLPLEPVNVIKEDPVNPELLYVGTDHGLYISLDRGDSFMPVQEGLPAVPVHDVLVHPRDHHLLVGTHGRSLYKADAAPLQELDYEVLAKPVYVYDIDETEYRESWGDKRRTWSEDFFEPVIELVVYAKSNSMAKVSIKSGDILVKSWEVQMDAGLNYFEYNASIDKNKLSSLANSINDGKGEEEKIELEPGENGLFYLPPGTYSINFSVGKETSEKALIIKD
ncbi:MAG: glycosyl hydrolase [Bacteroidota bacterium]